MQQSADRSMHHYKIIDLSQAIDLIKPTLFVGYCNSSPMLNEKNVLMTRIVDEGRCEGERRYISLCRELRERERGPHNLSHVRDTLQTVDPAN